MTSATSTQEATTVQKKGRNNLALWIVQVVLALLFLFAGGIKLVLPLDQSAAPIALPVMFLRFIGVVEVLGGLGLILPGLLGIRRGLTQLAAIGLAIIMVGAIVFGIVGGPIVGAVLPFVVLLLLAWVAYERRNWK